MSPNNPQAQFTGPTQDDDLKAKAMDIEAGLLGKLLGSSKNAPIIFPI
jgi:hypothetical protein